MRPCPGDDADQALVDGAETEGHCGTVRVTRGNRRSNGEPGFGGPLRCDRAGDGQGLGAVAEQSGVAFEPERFERSRRPAAEALVNEARRGHVADLEADLTSQTKA